MDISTSGAKIRTGQQIGRVGDHLDIQIEVQVASFTESLVVLGIIRNEDLLEEEYYYGVQFEGLDQHEVLVVHSFVLEQMAGRN